MEWLPLLSSDHLVKRDSDGFGIARSTLPSSHGARRRAMRGMGVFDLGGLNMKLVVVVVGGGLHKRPKLAPFFS